MSTQALVLLAHGSRNAEARQEYVRLWQAVAARLDVPIEFGSLEFPGEDLPSIHEAVRRCAAAGASRVVGLPYFLFSAGHVGEDVPGELAEAAEQVGVVASYEPPLGVDPAILDTLEERTREAARRLQGGAEEPYALLLVGAGTSDPGSNAELSRAARLLFERRAWPVVDTAFVSLTEPSVPEMLRRCLAIGQRRVVLTPYFLNTGRLARRVDTQVEQTLRATPGLDAVVAGYLGLHPRMIDLVVERARLGLARQGTETDLSLPPCARSGRPWDCWRRA